MAWASKKQYAILMGSEEGKKLADKLSDMEQEDFNKAFSKLIGRSNKKEDADKKAHEEQYSDWDDLDYERAWGPARDDDEDDDDGKYQKSFKERTEEEEANDFEALTSDENIGTEFDDVLDNTDNLEEAKEKVINKIARDLSLKENDKDYSKLVDKVNAYYKENFEGKAKKLFGLEW